MCLTDFINVTPSPRPRITSLQAKEVLEVYYDIHGDLQSLGGAHHLNYRLETDTGYYVLTVYHGDYPADELHAQLDALKVSKTIPVPVKTLCAWCLPRVAAIC